MPNDQWELEHERLIIQHAKAEWELQQHRFSKLTREQFENNNVTKFLETGNEADLIPNRK